MDNKGKMKRKENETYNLQICPHSHLQFYVSISGSVLFRFQVTGVELHPPGITQCQECCWHERNTNRKAEGGIFYKTEYYPDGF